jgi:hypothetical protein
MTHDGNLEIDHTAIACGNINSKAKITPPAMSGNKATPKCGVVVDANEGWKHQHISEHVATACISCCFNSPVIENEMEMLKRRKVIKGYFIECCSCYQLHCLHSLPSSSFIYISMILQVSIHLSSVSSSTSSSFQLFISSKVSLSKARCSRVHKQIHLAFVRGTTGTNTIHLSGKPFAHLKHAKHLRNI